ERRPRMPLASFRRRSLRIRRLFSGIFRKERLHRQATCRRVDVGASEANVAQKMVIDLQQRVLGDISLAAASGGFQCTVEKNQDPTSHGTEALNGPAKLSQPILCPRDRFGRSPTLSSCRTLFEAARSRCRLGQSSLVPMSYWRWADTA